MAEQTKGPDARDVEPITAQEDLRVPRVRESCEAPPRLVVRVHGPCDSAGTVIGLKEEHRLAAGLGKDPGQVAKVCDEDGKFLGFYVAGLGKAKLYNPESPDYDPDACTANVDLTEGHKRIIVSKAVDIGGEILRLPLKANPEADVKAADLERRRGVIRERLKLPEDIYLTLPIGLCAAAGFSALYRGPVIPDISVAKFQYGGKEVNMVVVPAGAHFGIMPQAAQKLSEEFGIPNLSSGILTISCQSGKTFILHNLESSQ